MKNRLEKFNINWEKANCHICSSQSSPEPLRLYGRPLTTGQFGYQINPVICQCGLVYLNPRWTSQTYDYFYKHYYDELYRLELKPDYGIQGVINNMVQVWKRTKHNPITNKISTILDIGCGSGYGLNYLKKKVPEASIFGIEASPDCCDIFRNKISGILIDTDINGPWADNYKGYFNFIIMRHVAEHLLTPVDSFKRIKKALAPNGIIYMAVPDMMHPRTVLRDYNKWWEYYFRAVHPYYYSKDTFFATLRAAGLYPCAYGEENEELWCLVSHKDHGIGFSKNIYKKQKEILKKYLPQ